MIKKLMVILAIVCLFSSTGFANTFESKSAKSVAFSEAEIEYMNRPEVKAVLDEKERLAELHLQYRTGTLSKKGYIAELEASGRDSDFVNKVTRIAPLESIDEFGSSSKTSAALLQNSLSISHVTQQNGYYCGPATAYMALKYNVPSFSGSQSSLANSLIYYDQDGDPGTPWNIGYNANNVLVFPMQNVLNQYMYVPWYLPKNIDYNTTASSLKADIISTIDAGYPVAGNICNASLNGFYTPGHWLIISGYKNSGNTITIYDPAYGQQYGALSATFDVSIATLHDALLGRGIIW